jgi:acetyl-CoA carboxylase carboxyl transferase subunit beta
MSSRIDVSIEHRNAPEPPGEKHPNTCPKCDSHYRDDELEAALWVCTHCGYHFPMRARTRIALLADGGTFVEEAAGLRSEDPLDFFDLRPYTERLAEAEMKTGLGEAMVIGQASVDGKPCELAVMDFAFMGGSMGSVVGEKIARLGQKALERKFSLILVSASGGARMQEGVLSLMQMAKAAAILSQLAERRIPYVSILTNPTTGGVSASYAMLGDAILAEPGAVIGFAGPRVIKQTIGQDLPDGFQTSEFLLEHGMVDAVVHRKELKNTVGQLLRHMSGKPAVTGWTAA